LFFSAWSASLAHAWAILSSSSLLGRSPVSLARRTQVSAHWRYRYGRTGTPPKPEPGKCLAAMRQNWGDMMVLAANSMGKKTPGLTQRPEASRAHLPTGLLRGRGQSRLACTLCGEPPKLLKPIVAHGGKMLVPLNASLQTRTERQSPGCS
jgi:hypothetical protein